MSTPEREHIAGRVAALIDDVAMREKVEALKKGGACECQGGRFLAQQL
jgi:hypothetical protein